MLSDIEIAQGCQMRPITEVAAAAGLDADDLELYVRKILIKKKSSR